MDIISPALGCFTTSVVNPVGARFQVSRNLEDNEKELEMSRDNLVARRDGQRRELEEAMRQEGVEESAEAKNWFTQVDRALSDFESLQNQNEQRRGQLCPNCFCYSRYQLSKRALKLKDVVDKLCEADLKSGRTTAPILQKGRIMNTVSIHGQNTREELMANITAAVLDDRYVVVGLHGLGGVGKTLLLRHSNNYFRHTNDFRFVIFTTVSATPNFIEIRKQIAQGLGLDCRDDDKDVKEKLCRPSSITGKYLLILDDMWEHFDVDEIFIPPPTKENGCKILMASRLIPVGINFVNSFAQRDFLQLIQVNSLPPEEAWNLFVRKVGKRITCKPEIEPLAEQILRKCGGLPLAINVIGGTMSTRETEGEWKDAIHELEQHSASNLEGMEKVFSILKFSFDKLEQIEQSLFLYCCLFPEDSIIPKVELVNFAIGEETMLHDQLGDMRNKVDVLVGKLRNSSMLEDAGNGRIKMHDVMREVGLWITSPDQWNKNQYSTKFIVKARARISEAPHALEWLQANKISLMQSCVESLPDQLPHSCPQLHTLLLGGCNLIKEVPQVHFLDQMPGLRILDLSYTSGVKYLPPSISDLVNLRLLCLRGCTNLQELPPEIGMLVHLISLDLYSCHSLRKLPLEMKNLNNLRRLDIEMTYQLKRIPFGVLSGLHKLQELETKGSALILHKNGLQELSQLTHLTYISIDVIEKMRVFHWSKPLARSMCALRLRNCAIDPSILPNLVEDSPGFSREVVFNSCEGLTCVPTSGCTSLTVQDCPDLKTLLIVKEAERNAFESLYELELDQLDQLETICTGVPHSRCFTNLEFILIQACPNLKELFTDGVTRLLKNLNHLLVYQCSQLVKLVSDQDLDIDAFPSLQTLSLCELPELTVICNLDLSWPSLSAAHVYLCPNLRRPMFGAHGTDILLNEEMDSWMTNAYLREWVEDEVKKRDEETGHDEEEEGGGGST